MNSRQILLGLSLVATLVAVYFVPDPDADKVILKVSPVVTSSASAGSKVHDHVSFEVRRSIVLDVTSRRPESKGINIFQTQVWRLTTTNPVLQEELSPPALAQEVAPPLPFRPLGRYLDEGKTGIFLQHNDQNLVVYVGDTIAGHYKVESLEGNVLSLRYLPLDLVQTLDIGSSP